MNIPKFRAWDKKRSRMFKVNAIRFNHPNGFEPTVLVDEGNGVESTLKLDDCILMQSTGLKDKNGVEIFDGDIINVGNGFINKVDYRLDDGCWRLKSVNGRCLCSYFSNYDSKDEWIIIGNIYENSELLEG